jgi:hypothetical protein
MTSQPTSTEATTGSTATQERMVVRCHVSSYTPEVHDFFGSTADVLNKIDRVDMGLGERRMFLLGIDGARGAQLHLFEHVGGDTWAVSGWKGDSIEGLPGRIGEMIFQNKGEFCVGKATQGLLGEIFGEFELRDSVELTEGTGTEVFGPIVTAYQGEGYLRATAGLLC